jgi:hypothetical protein
MPGATGFTRILQPDRAQGVMTMTIKALVAALTLMAAGLPVAVAAAAGYQATPLEKAELAQLTPDLRKEVESRMVNGQTVRGILETMLLNNLSLLFASNRVVAADFDKGVVAVEGKNNEIKTYPFDIATLVIRN